MQNKKLNNDYGRYTGMPYGDMDIRLLTNKFEQSYYDDGDLVDRYDDFARNNLMDRTGDRNLFEHEQFKPRNPGRLQLQYNGHRGDAEQQYQPERFIGFDDHESPAAVDVQKLRDQHASRMRFQRFQSDDTTGQISGGGFSQQRAQKDKDQMFKRVKRIKVFDRSLDGRLGGQRLIHGRGTARESQLTNDRTDRLSDFMETPIKRVIAFSDDLLRADIESMDADLYIADYSQARKQAAPIGDGIFQPGEVSMDFGNTTTTKLRRALAHVMADSVSSLRDGTVGDRTFGAESNTKAIKQAQQQIRAVLDVMHTAAFSHSDTTKATKTAAPVRRGPLNVQNGHQDPLAITAQIIYKSAAHGDFAAIADDIVFDSKVARDFAETAARKRGAHIAGHNRELIEDADRIGNNKNVMVYKSLHGHAKGPDMHFHSTDQSQTESDATKTGRTTKPVADYTRDTYHSMNFGTNDKIERFTAAHQTVRGRNHTVKSGIADMKTAAIRD